MVYYLSYLNSSCFDDKNRFKISTILRISLRYFWFLGASLFPYFDKYWLIYCAPFSKECRLIDTELREQIVSMILWASSNTSTLSIYHKKQLNNLLFKEIPKESLVDSLRILWYGVTITSASLIAFLEPKYPQILS